MFTCINEQYAFRTLLDTKSELTSELRLHCTRNYKKKFIHLPHYVSIREKPQK